MPSLAPSATLRAAIYVRSATIAQVDDDRLTKQIAESRQLAGSLSADTITEYSDVASGTSSDRPGLQALLSAVRQGEIDLILCERPDRLARGLVMLHEIEAALGRFGVAVHYADADPPERQAVTEALADPEVPSAARKAR